MKLSWFLFRIALVGLWVAIDLTSRVPVDIRNFNPDEVAALDTKMWRS